MGQTIEEQFKYPHDLVIKTFIITRVGCDLENFLNDVE